MNDHANIAQAFVDQMTDDEIHMFNWRMFHDLQLRRNQKPPDTHWSVCLMQAGRGFGKTLAGAGWTVNETEKHPGIITGVMSPTHSDLYRVLWGGPSGIWSIMPEPLVAGGNPFSSVHATLTNRSKIQSFSGKTPERLRGPQHHRFWFDEPAGMKDPHKAYDQILFGLRLMSKTAPIPKLLITSTPKPIPLFKRIKEASLKRPDKYVIMRGSTMDNLANLSEAAIDELRAAYEGTRLGRQELYGELLEDFDGALWKQEYIQIGEAPPLEKFDKIVVGVDPSGTQTNNEEGSDEVGIIVAGVIMKVGNVPEYWVLHDGSVLGGPPVWARKVVELFHSFRANRVVAEKNFGGGMVQHTINSADPDVPVKLVTASRGKHVRAEPVALAYEQGKCYHNGNFSKLVDQMVLMTSFGWMGEGSPDRLDACVWAMSELIGGKLSPTLPPMGPVQVSGWTNITGGRGTSPNRW